MIEATKTENDKEFLDLVELGEYLGISMSTVYRFIHDKEHPLPSFRLTNRTILVNKKELHSWLEIYRTKEVKS
jgi:excisionase family DNA binding protein